MSDYQKLTLEERNEILAKINDLMLYNPRSFNVFKKVIESETEIAERNHIKLPKYGNEACKDC